MTDRETPAEIVAANQALQLTLASTMASCTSLAVRRLWAHVADQATADQARAMTAALLSDLDMLERAAGDTAAESIRAWRADLLKAVGDHGRPPPAG